MYNNKKHIKLVIDLGTVFSKYIVVLSINGNEKFLSARMLKTPTDIFNDEGLIVDQTKLEAFLDSIINTIQSNKHTKNLDIVVYLGLSYIENLATHVSNPYSENKDFDKELKELIGTSEQYDNEKFSFNYDFKNAINTHLAVCDTLIVGYDKTIINSYLRFFDKRGIFVKSITLSNLAISKALAKRKIDESFDEIDYSLLVDIGASTTEVVLLKNDFPLNYFIINMGGNDITNTLKDYYNITFAEAEELKVSINESYFIYKDYDQSYPYDEKASKIIDIVSPVFEEWKNKIYEQVNNELKLSHIPYIKNVYFTGGSSYIKNFPKSIAMLFQAHQEEISLNHLFQMDKIKREADIIYYNLQSFLPVLCHLKTTPLNLVTKDYMKSKITKAPNFKGGNALLVASLAFFIGANAFGYIQTQTNNHDVKNINTKMDSLTQSQQNEQIKVQRFDSLDRQVAVFEKMVNEKIKWSSLMKKIYDSTQPGIQIQEVHEIGEGQIEISGVALNYSLIGNFGKLLEANGAMEGVTPSDVQTEPVELTDGTKYDLKKFYMRGKINANNIIH